MRFALFAAATTLVISPAVGAQGTHAATRSPTATRPTDAALIANALSAAPVSVAAGATVVAHDGRVLRKGTTDWVCMPDMADVPNDSPMCLDASWRAFIGAWMKKQAPAVSQVGFGYMLQGDMPVSNTDPFASSPTAGNMWLQDSGPHVMMLLPDAGLLEEMSTDPRAGGPYVMWKGTPYAHVMVPVVRRTR